MALALFDLDNTLLNGDSDHAWGIYLTEIGVVDAITHQQAQDQFYQQYVDGSLDIKLFLEFQLAELSKHSVEQLQQWHSDFMQKKIIPIIAPDKVALLEKHRDAGDDLVIITATNDFVTHPIAQYLNVDTLIATQAEKTNNCYTGNVSGTPSFQQGKVERLNEWMQQHNKNLTDSWFYSDSYNDLPLLELVDNPVAVTPDDRLRDHAQLNNWPIID